MARVVFIHNDQDAASRELLAQLQAAHPTQVEVLDFMAVRSQLWFRGCPAVWLLPTGSAGYDAPAWKGEVDVVTADVDAALPAARVIHLATDATTINRTGGAAPNQAAITAALTDLDGNPAAMDGVTFLAGGQVVQAPDGVLQFSSATAGTFTVSCQHPTAADAQIQVVVQ